MRKNIDFVMKTTGYRRARGQSVNMLLSRVIILLLCQSMTGFTGSMTVNAGNNIMLDDNTVIENVNGELTAYIPQGHPRIPLVQGDGDIIQAHIPENESIGYAKIDNTLIKFVKTEEKGFVLQYDDHYEYDFGLDGNVEYTSSNPDVAVYENGAVVVKSISDEAVTITASNGIESRELVIDKTVKAPINVMLVIGQSNSEGAQGDSTVSDKPKAGVAYTYCGKWHGSEASEFVTEMSALYKDKYEADGGPANGFAFKNMYNDYVCSYVHTKSKDELDQMPWDERIEKAAEHENKIIDLSEGWKGFPAAYTKEYYEQTGEKSFAILAGVGGSAMFEWYPEYNDGLAGPVLYENCIQKYNDAIRLLAENGNYEIRSKGYFWIQGEADIMCWANYVMIGKTDPDCGERSVYKERLLSLHNHLKEELGMEYGALFIIRYTSNGPDDNYVASKRYSYLAPVRIAQFELAAEHGDIYIATDLCELIPNSMSDNGFHYNQNGYNLIGKDAADIMEKRNDPMTDQNVTDVSLYIDYSNVQYDNNKVIVLDPQKGMTADDRKKYSIAFNIVPGWAECDNFALEYDRESGLLIEDGTISITEDFTQTSLTVIAGNLTKTYTIRNMNCTNNLEARYDEENNYIYLSGEIGKNAGASVGISVIDPSDGSCIYADQITAGENNLIDYLIKLDNDIENVYDYKVHITVPDANYSNNTGYELNIAALTDKVDLKLSTVINKDAQPDDMYTYSASVTLDSVFKVPVDGTLILAYYDKAGKLMSIDQEYVSLNAENGYACTKEKGVLYDMYTAKAFFINSLDELVPLTDNVMTLRR